MSEVQIATFYQFIPGVKSNAVVEAQAETIRQLAEKLSVSGLIIFGREGVNATVCGSELCTFVDELATLLETQPFQVKWSSSDVSPFKTFKVKVRDEIVSLGKPEILPGDSSDHLSPEEWQRALESEDVVLLDTRNWYETQLGTFKNAIDPHIDEFNEFPQYLRNSGLPKDKKILIFCTGGIRCEKAAVEMREQGFEKVYQLDGGILNYLEKFPRQNFEGECFVFDHRMAVDQDLRASATVKMCPHCGQPAFENISCRRCDFETWICAQCNEVEAKQTCSKNCAHHFARSATGGTHTKGRKQLQGYRYEMSLRKEQRRQLTPK